MLNQIRKLADRIIADFTPPTTSAQRRAAAYERDIEAAHVWWCNYKFEVNRQWRAGDITAREFIDQLASGLQEYNRLLADIHNDPYYKAEDNDDVLSVV